MSVSESLSFGGVRSRSLARWFATAVVVTVLGAQLVVGFMSSMNHTFPIMNYPMFSGPHYDGDRLDDYFVHAVLPDGSEALVTPEDVGMEFWTFRVNVVTEIIEAEDTRPLRPIADIICARHDVGEVTLRASDIGVFISRNGAVQGEPMEVGAVTLPCAR